MFLKKKSYNLVVKPIPYSKLHPVVKEVKEEKKVVEVVPEVVEVVSEEVTKPTRQTKKKNNNVEETKE